MYQLSLFPNEPPIEPIAKASDRLPEVNIREDLTPGAIFALGNHRLLCGNSLDRNQVYALLNGLVVDAVITDPPYGVGLDTWDSSILSDDLIAMWSEITSDKCFVAFFGQMPTLLDWCNAVSKYFRFKDHISWAKRSSTGIYLELLRTHESIMLYRKKNPKYFVTKGPYEDVKVPGVLFDVISIDGIQRHIADLNYNLKYGVPREKQNNSEHRCHSSFLSYKPTSLVAIKNTANFTNLWSFMPENIATRMGQKLSHHHPTVKPLLLMNRLVELLADTKGVVFDPFLGSGSTLLACENTDRICYGVEIDLLYCEVILQRWEKLTNKKAVKSGDI